MLCAISASALDSGTESSGNQGSSNVTITGKSYSLDGKFIAGKGGVKQGDMPDKGVKLRSNQGNLVFEVADGYKITGFRFWGCANKTTAVTIESATVDGGSNLLGADVVLPANGASSSGNINLSSINATDNITLTFAEGSTEQIVGTWSIDYEQTAVVLQEIDDVSLNGASIGSTDLATLKSAKAVTIDGSSLNGLGTLEVTLSSGATTVSRSISGSNAVFTFTINSTEEYTITVTGVAKSYAAATGKLGYYSKNGENVTGANSSEVVSDGITFTYASKTFQYGSGSVTLGSDVYVPLKLSTGEPVNVTFPTGKKAVKLIVYGWSANGNGKLTAIQETSDASGKKVDCSSDIFYAGNTASDIYPSVYEYDLDNWESMYFTGGGSASQPFVVMQFVFADEVTVSTAGYATYVLPYDIDFTGISGVTAYAAKANGEYISLANVDAAPAGTPLVLQASAGTYTMPKAAVTPAAISENDLVAGPVTGDGASHYVLGKEGDVVGFGLLKSGVVLGATKAYIPAAKFSSGARFYTFFNSETTGINNVEKSYRTVDGVFNLNGQRVAQPTKGMYIVNGKKYIVK